MPSTCVFMYDRPNSVYYSGDLLNGKIILTTDKVKNVRGVYITIKGVAKVRWTERKSRQNHHTNKREHYTVHYHGDQEYLHSRTLVEGDMDLPAGIHEYAFHTPLPVQIPSSISAEHGHVSYEVELKLDRPMRPDNVYTNCFTVIRPLNLNLDPSYMQPIVDEDQKFFCCCCCESGPLNSELRTEFAGYAPGQKINFTVLIDNEANKDMEGCSVELVQSIAFQSQSPEHKTKIVENVIGSVTLEGANRFSKKLHKGSIEVPPVPPTTMGPADIINVSYFLRAEIESGLCSSNEELHAPITIGTVPLAASATNPNSVITVQPTAPIIDSNGDDGDKPPQYGSIVPPSFEEATGMNKPFVDDEADENRVVDPFVPKYPVYHNFATPSAPDGVQSRLTEQSQETSWSPAPPPYPPPAENASAPGLPSPTGDSLDTSSQQPVIPPYPVAGFGCMPIPGMPLAPESSGANVEGPIGWRS